ncbi:hypothetical protein Tco_0462401 [Tanacetum coccineum]
MEEYIQVETEKALRYEKENASNGGWNDYKTHEEWKLIKLEKSKPKHDNHECIRKYELMIDDQDFDYMCDYLLSNDGPFFMNEEKERVDEGKYKLVGTPQDRMKKLGEEYDEWIDIAYSGRADHRVLIEEDMTGVMTELILRECMEKAQAESSLAKPKTDNDVKIKLSEEFLMELRSNAYYGTDDEDVVYHIAKFLKILNLIKTHNVDTYRLRMQVNGSWNEEPMDDIVSSDEEWEESDYGNPPNTNTD